MDPSSRKKKNTSFSDLIEKWSTNFIKEKKYSTSGEYRGLSGKAPGGWGFFFASLVSDPKILLSQNFSKFSDLGANFRILKCYQWLSGRCLFAFVGCFYGNFLKLVVT